MNEEEFLDLILTCSFTRQVNVAGYFEEAGPRNTESCMFWKIIDITFIPPALIFIHILNLSSMETATPNTARILLLKNSYLIILDSYLPNDN